MAGGSGRARGRLPHWEKPGGIYFVTFRLAGSLPREVIEAARAESRENRTGGRPTSARGKRVAMRRIERYLDEGAGAAHLRNPEAAKVVAEALSQFDGTRYELYAWCVLPNHVHVALRPLGNWRLRTIVHSWKSFTGKKLLGLLGLKPPFWQRGYFDRLVRDGEEFTRIVRYVAQNPAKAGLKNWRWAEVSTRL
jgi:putative DNA methylase